MEVSSPCLVNFMRNSVEKTLLKAVQKNCDIADALSATDFTLCVYLMKMREYFRWHHAIPYGEHLDSEELGVWIRQTEARWDDLEDREYGSVPLSDYSIDPFETDAANRNLNPRSLVYSAGFGNQGKAHFFLAALIKRSEHKNFQILVSGEEYARDLVSPVAMTLGSTIFLRQQALERLIWEKSQEVSWNKSETPMSRALKAWDFQHNPETAIQAAAEHLQSVFIHHEVGEVMAGQHLGEIWEDMLATHLNSKLEFQLRAIRDTLADVLSTLPHLIEESNAAKIHFYFGLLSPMRKVMFPSLVNDYDRWNTTGDIKSLQESTERLVPFCLELCETLTQRFDPEVNNNENLLSETLERQFEPV